MISQEQEPLNCLGQRFAAEGWPFIVLRQPWGRGKVSWMRTGWRREAVLEESENSKASAGSRGWQSAVSPSTCQWPGTA